MSTSDLEASEPAASPFPPARPKRIVICLDGTWANPATEQQRDDGDKVYKPSNVLKTHRAIKDLADSTAVLTFTAAPADGDSVTVAGKTYTFRENLDADAGDGVVKVDLPNPADGAVTSNSQRKAAYRALENLFFAINLKRHRGRYSDATTRHPGVSARPIRRQPDRLEIVALRAGVGDPFEVTASFGGGSWSDQTGIGTTLRDRQLAPDLGIPQVSYYDLGVGALREFPGFSNKVHRTVDKWFGGAAGAGFEGNVEDAYGFLSINYRRGDEIYLFGFSRGAATARGLSRFIDWMGGILPSNNAYWTPRYFDAFLRGDSFDETHRVIWEDDAADKITPARIRFLGVWDSVLSIGKQREQPHFGPAPPAIVEHARQALAIDEQRFDFLPKIWQRAATTEQTLEQRWFAGVHTNIGGGYVNDGLANVALRWLLREAHQVGLGLDWDFLASYRPYSSDQLYDSSKWYWRGLEKIRRKNGRRQLQVSRQAGLTIHSSVFRRLVAQAEENGRVIHSKLTSYRPDNLLDFLASAAVPDLDSFLTEIPGLPEDFELGDELRREIEGRR